MRDKELMIPENHIYRAQGEGVMNFVATDLAGEHKFGMPPATPRDIDALHKQYGLGPLAASPLAQPSRPFSYYPDTV